jgi:putative sporulation protein YtxC
MKSYCIKTNNTQIIDYLLKSLDTISLNDIYYINKKFKIYNNVIVHYKGNNESLFLSTFANIISDCITLFYEPNLIQRIINYNYFYFDNFEKKEIEDICYTSINLDDDNNFKYRKEEIWIAVLKYISENKSMVLDGFVNFRLENYNSTLEELVNYSVNKYVVEKEYTEFINLLKLYINSKECGTDLIHLVYVNGESFLLDKNKNSLDISDEIFNAKYLSDISFSSNDYALNALLTLLPKKIEIHIVGNEDEFITTLKHIFENRIFICKDCNICKTYKILTNSNNAK